MSESNLIKYNSLTHNNLISYVNPNNFNFENKSFKNKISLKPKLINPLEVLTHIAKLQLTKEEETLSWCKGKFHFFPFI